MLETNTKWPEGKRIAVMLAFDVDGEILWLQRGKGLNSRHICNLSRGRYSTLQAVPRILNMLEKEGLPATFFTPSWIAEQYPEVPRAIVDGGHEIGYHGYFHETMETYEAEKANIEKSQAIIEGIAGKKMVGHRGPNGIIYDYSLPLWKECGFIYSSNWRDSDGPFIHEINGEKIPLVELPKDSIFDDTAYDMYTENFPPRHNLRSGREMIQVWTDEFDALAREGRMLNLVMHPQFIGRPGNLRALRDFIHYMRGNGAWFATNEQAARHVLQQEHML